MIFMISLIFRTGQIILSEPLICAIFKISLISFESAKSVNH